MHRNAKRNRRGLPLLWRFRDGGSAAGRGSWLLRRHDVGIGVVLRGRFSSEELQNSVECLAEDIHKDAPCWPLCYQQSSATSLLRYCGQPSAPSKKRPGRSDRKCAHHQGRWTLRPRSVNQCADFSPRSISLRPVGDPMRVPRPTLRTASARSSEGRPFRR